MKKTYLSPLCSIFQIEGADNLLVASNPATAMETPDTGIYDNTDPWNVPNTDGDEDDDWGF